MVLVSIADGSARLLDLQGQFFALSEVAAQMLGDTLEAWAGRAAESVARRWEVDVERVKRDLDTFLAELLLTGLLVPGRPAGSPASAGRLAGRHGSVRPGRPYARPVAYPEGQSGRTAGAGPPVVSLARLGSGRCAASTPLFLRAEPIRDGSGLGEEARSPTDEAVRQAVAQSASSLVYLQAAGSHQLGPGRPLAGLAPATGHRAEPLSAARPLLVQLGPMIILGDRPGSVAG